MSALVADNVSIAYGNSVVVQDISLTVDPGEVVVITGPSGCGKSSLLRTLAGLLTPSSGQILVGDNRVRRPSRDLAMVFQDDALLPWRTVRKNILLALKLRGVPARQRAAQADQWLDEIGLTAYRNHLPRQLSGGMRQRVQLARGLAGAPAVVLMDEPFGALDAQTRASMQALLLKTIAAHPCSVVFVTHDVDEALLLADRVLVLAADGRTVDAEVVVPQSRTPDANSRLRTQIVDALHSRKDLVND